jgi:hypothetical protein
VSAGQFPLELCDRAAIGSASRFVVRNGDNSDSDGAVLQVSGCFQSNQVSGEGALW